MVPAESRPGAKVLGLLVDSADDHRAWAQDIEDTQGHALNYPVIADADFHVATLYGMLPAGTAGGCAPSCLQATP